MEKSLIHSEAGQLWTNVQGNVLHRTGPLCSWIKLAWRRLRAQEGVRGPVQGHLPTCTPQPELDLMATGFQEAPVPVKLQCEACWPAFIQHLLRTFYMPCAVTGTKKTEFSLLKFPIACQERAWEGSRKGTGPCLQSHELTVLMQIMLHAASLKSYVFYVPQCPTSCLNKYVGTQRKILFQQSSWKGKRSRAY